jgi:hypothetical protein
MQLTADQQQSVRQWLAEGAKLADVQKRLETQFGLKLTYMEVRFLVDDLKVIPKDPEVPKQPEPAAKTPVPGPAAPATDIPEGEEEYLPPPGSGSVKVTVDTVTRPGAIVSGRVVFSDGKGAAWLVDQYGRPGLVADEKGYRPSPSDLSEFQVALERELVRLGM